MTTINTYIKQAIEQINLIDTHDSPMYPSMYDTAWVGQIRRDDGRLYWPEANKILIDAQHSDGSWGSCTFYLPDRIISTLVACITLKKNLNELPSTAGEAIHCGETFLQEHLSKLNSSPQELVGFELIYPTLHRAALRAGLQIPPWRQNDATVVARKNEKLSKIPPQKLCSRYSTTAHSIEFLGRKLSNVDFDIAQRLIGDEGIGNSPAATAYFLSYFEDIPSAFNYLDRVIDQGMPYLFPCRFFELVWALNALSYSGAPIAAFAPDSIWTELEQSIKNNGGVGLDESFGIVDGDITSVSIKLLLMNNRPVSPSVLNEFQTEEGVFRTYHYERNRSVGTNLHALEAITAMGNYRDYSDSLHSILSLVRSELNEGVIYDKWHISPLYAISHLVPALKKCRAFRDDLQQIIQKVLAWQYDDGSWGWHASTLEETAYGVLALGHYYQVCPSDHLRQAIIQGQAYLQKHWEIDKPHPELWIGKCLYTPYRIVNITILSALILCENSL